MKETTKQNKRFLMPAAVLSAVLFFVFGLNAASSTLSDSLKDDVTAMITNAKQLPHTMFILDTSESMNSFAYSDYIDTCADGKTNIAQALIMCKNAYNQCLDIQSDVGCLVDLGCGDITANCKVIEDKERDLKKYCNKIEVMFQEPDRRDNSHDSSNAKYIGPWNPQETYDADLCFYDWSQDTDGDVLENTTSGHWTNPTGGENSDRRDWDCITDGKDRMYNGKDQAGKDKFYPTSFSQMCDSSGNNCGLSGYWLNWKYATSLDAVKIILANKHKFSYPPRSRGENKCFRSSFYPINLQDPSVCYIDFDTNICNLSATGCNADDRLEQLMAMRDIVVSNWQSEYELNGAGDPKEFPTNDCRSFSMETGFSIFPEGPDDHHKSGDFCGKCMYWNSETKAFEEVACSYFEGDEIHDNPVAHEAITLSASFGQKTCCKTYQCTNPKCRDDDVHCKNDTSYNCTLGYYSEYDQDVNHCCGTIDCAETGDANISANDCDGCIGGSPMGSDYVKAESGVIQVVGKPSGDCEGFNYQSNIPIQIKIKELSGIDPDTTPQTMESLKISLYYRCNNCSSSGAGDGENDPCRKPLGIYSCTPDTCAEGLTIASSSLSECESEGYSIEAFLEANRTGCKFAASGVTVDLEYTLGDYKCGETKYHKVLDPEKAYYQIYRMETSASDTNPIVNEYECKTAFYHRQSIKVDGTTCPSTDEARVLINAKNGGTGKVEYCDPASGEKETIDVDQWGFPTKVACSWMCRDGFVYDEPWKCATYFYKMNDSEYNGYDRSEIRNHCKKASENPSQLCSGNCDFSGTWTELEECCYENNKWERATFGLLGFASPEEPEGVQLSKVKTECWIGDYKYGGSQDYSSSAAAYMAELVTGHIQEAGSGSYKLTPYMTGGAYYSPYDEWYKDHCFYEKGKNLVNNTFISAFKTASTATDRKPVCIYDLDDCDSCQGTGCCAINDDIGKGCDNPQLWVKVPMSEGGEYIYGAKDFSADDDLQEFRNKISELKAIGGSTLGETLYDAWRYLGGMYAVYDPNHIVAEGNEPYQSPFENQDPSCFSNEAVIISGGSPQFDHNDTIGKTSKIPNTAIDCDSTKAPCVEPVTDELSPVKPYYQTQWYQTSLPKVANFVTKTSFWGKEACRTSKNLCVNVGGFEDNSLRCTNNDPTGGCKDSSVDYSATNLNKPVIKNIHSIAIGEWALTEYYGLFNNGLFGVSQDGQGQTLMEQVSKTTPGGHYYGLTTETPKLAGDAGEGGTFNDLTSLFGDMMTKPQPNDIVSGRPHWTSSLVQPYDVEEKYRGPETYSAGAVPIDGAVSRFWFGNLKKYMLDDETQGCGITDDNSSSAVCGAWTKQKFQSPKDCFADSGEEGSGFSAGTGSADSLEQFKTLMMGGAAYKLAQKLGNEGAGEWPYFKSSPRNIYYDDGSDSYKLTEKVTPGSRLYDAFAAANPNATFVTNETDDSGININKILDYMAGYDAFKSTTEERKHVRYGALVPAAEQSIEIDDPIDVDMGQKAKIKIRPLLLGAIIHSKPIAVYYESSATTRIYAGANDGMLHAFDHNGEEVYAYIPSLAMKSISDFGREQSGIFFNATVDGPITLLHIDQSHDGMINEGEKAYLIFGYRRGGKGYTVIDISDPDKPKFVQNLATDSANGSAFSFSFGKAAVFRKCQGQCSYANDLDYYIAVPGGYDTCHDPTKLTSNELKPSCLSSEVSGNFFTIFKFVNDPNSPYFEEVAKFSKNSPNSRISESDKSWLVTSFASFPFAINTSGKAAIDTEYVYFTDLSGSVFRVDVSSMSPSDWTAKLVFAQRSTATPNWSEFARSYAAASFFPPLEKYNPGNDQNIIPITLVTGDAANPKYIEQSRFLVFYDRKDLGESEKISYKANDFLQNTDGTTGNTNQLIPDRNGWNVSFAYPPNVPYDSMTDAQKNEYAKAGEKGITEPLITYDIYGGKSGTAKNSYTVAWNTYIPKRETQCRNFGTSSNYERMLLDGSQGLIMPSGLSGANGARGEWDPSKCSFEHKDISIATGVSIVASKNGYDLTFGAGADIFRKPELTVKTNSTHIIKWYELY